jgi:hypothetical protein
MDTPTRRPWWTYMRLSLRGLIVLVLLIGGILGRTVHQAQVQREAVAAITRAGGSVYYDWQVRKDGLILSTTKPWAPNWLVKLVGIDYFGHVARIDLLRGGADRDLILIGRLGQLWNLNLDSSPISDDGLVHLKALTGMERLYLPLTKVGDAGLVHLEGLTGLHQLGFYDNPITDEGLVHLKGLTDLEFLILDGTRVSGPGLAQLKGLKRLVGLSLTRTAVDDAGLKHLREMTGLKELFLGGTRVTDAGVRKLQEALPNLKISR